MYRYSNGYSDEETAGPLCGEKRESRWSLARSWTSVSLTDGRGWSAAHVIAMSVLVLNLRKIQRALLRMLAYLLEILAQNKNWALVH